MVEAACPGGWGVNRAGDEMAADAVADETVPVEFGILGPLEVCRSGYVVPLGGPRQRAVLALLLLEANRVVSMDRLAEDIWGGDPPEGWVTTLQTYVFHLRQALEPGRARGVAGHVLVTRGRGYLLRVDRAHLDAALFQDGLTVGRAALDAGRYGEAAGTLRETLDLWRGGVLADLADYAFTRPEAARLEELRLASLEARIDADLALGRHATLTAELEQLVAEHPLRERLHGQLMLALYRCGRQAEALAAYRRAHDLFADELGIDPGEPLRRLHASILTQDPSLDGDGGRAAPAMGHRTPAGTPVTPAEPQPARALPIADHHEPARSRRGVRRLLAIGTVLAIAVAAAIGAVARPWAHGPAGLPGSTMGLIGPAGGRPGAAVSVGSPAGLAYGDGSVWAVDSAAGTVSRINPASHAVVQQIMVGSAPSAVSVTGGNVWVANSGDGTVSQINAAAGRVVQKITVGNIPVAIASGRSGVWVANEGDGTVTRIDPITGMVTRRGVQVGARPDGIAVGPDAVWVANSEDGTVTRIDPASGQPSGPLAVGSGPEGIAVTPAAVWVANSLDLTVSKIDPATSRVIDTVQVGDGPGSIVAAGNAVWVSDEFDATLDRIDPHTDRVIRTIHLGSSPQGIVMDGPTPWVAVRPFAAASHRGGTLTEVNYYLPVPDPVLADNPPSYSALATAYDSLVALRRSGGAPGLTLVPDLATTLPRPAEGGTAYTFTLRPRIRYSNGTLLRASDFRRGIQRQLSFGASPGYYEGILGAPACHRHPQRCDLSAGIVTDDTADTVTFHLSRPDPDFPDKLALPTAAPAPPGAPDHAISRAPFLPGTGPYMISQYRPNVSFTLVRNPFFRQWSYAAQPAGYPSVIRDDWVYATSKEESAVITGRADLVQLDEEDRALAVQYPARVHLGLKLSTFYVVLNTHQPPFTNIKARQAVNYAIDRARLIQFSQLATGQITATCQMLPADFPGHHSYCPYTAGAQGGGWHAPDMAKALQLVQESHTTNVPVTIWATNDAPTKAGASYLTHLLIALGYRARLHTVSFNQFNAGVDNPHLKIQMAWAQGWNADYPAPSTFFGPVLSCRSSHEPAIGNLAEFCDPEVDKLASEAQAAQSANPTLARGLWAQADRLVTDQAPYVPVFNETSAGFVSSRVGNYQTSPEYGPLLDQMWVR
jgi:YVTN family beta-propeller protein